MRLLIAGAQGQVSQALADAVRGHTGVVAVAFGRPTLDLQSPETIRRAVYDFAPDVVINAAAYTAVDRAEAEPNLAHAINCVGARLLAEAAAAQGAAIIHLSTDYVFDGGKASPYVEDDSTNPLNVYGRSKLAGEVAVNAANSRHVIVRTSWVHSATGNNFVKTMLRLAGERDVVRVVDDQIGNPTYAPHLAEALMAMALAIAGQNEHKLFGVFDVVGSGATSWCGLAQATFAAAAEFGVRVPTVDAISTAAYPTPAQRPMNSRLDCGKLEQIYGITLPPWQEGVVDCVARLCR